jgi:mercuric ion transport protein
MQTSGAVATLIAMETTAIDTSSNAVGRHEPSSRHAVGVGMSALVPALAAAATWLCCLPIALGAVGIGTAAFATALTPLRPYLSGLALALIGVALFQVHRPGGSTCARDGSCAVRSSRIRTKLLLWSAAIITIALLTVDRWSSYVILWFL